MSAHHAACIDGQGSASGASKPSGIATQVAQVPFVACGGPGLRMATPAFNRAWRTVSGLTWSSFPIEAQELPEA